MLHLCRLTDPAEIKGRKNLTVMALTENIIDPAFKVRVQLSVEEVQKNSEFARKWRNRRLAHADLQTFRKGLPPVDSANIDTALKSIGSLLALIEDHFGLPHFALMRDPWGAKSLVYWLERTKRAIDDERQSWHDAAKGAATS